MAAMEAEGRLAICGYTPYKPDELPVAAVEEKYDHTTRISQLEEEAPRRYQNLPEVIRSC